MQLTNTNGTVYLSNGCMYAFDDCKIRLLVVLSKTYNRIPTIPKEKLIL